MFYGVDLTAQMLIAKLTVLHVFPPKLDDGRERAIYGIATHGSELFVVRDESSTVDVYRTSDFVESRHVTVPGMKDPVSLVACPHYNCLYISDYRLECIHRVDLSNSP